MCIVTHDHAAFQQNHAVLFLGNATQACIFAKTQKSRCDGRQYEVNVSLMENKLLKDDWLAQCATNNDGQCHMELPCSIGEENFSPRDGVTNLRHK